MLFGYSKVYDSNALGKCDKQDNQSYIALFDLYKHAAWHFTRVHICKQINKTLIEQRIPFPGRGYQWTFSACHVQVSALLCLWNVNKHERQQTSPANICLIPVDAWVGNT